MLNESNPHSGTSGMIVESQVNDFSAFPSGFCITAFPFARV